MEFRHEWEVVIDTPEENPGLWVRCVFCRAVVEVIMVESPEGEIFLRTHLIEEGAHPVSNEDLDYISKAVYHQFVLPQLHTDASGEVH